MVLLFLGAGSSTPGLIGYTFSAFVLAAIALEFARGTSARHATARESWPRAFSSLIGRNRRRYGGYIVHAAIVLLAIGIVGSSAYDSKHTANLRPGQSLAVGSYTLTVAGRPRYTTVPNIVEGRTPIEVRRGGSVLGTLHPGQNYYKAEDQTSREVSIRSDYLTGEDLFLNAVINKDGSVHLEASVKPLVNLIWLSGLVFIFGSVVAMWPDGREQRRLATRYAEQPAYARA